MTALGLVRVVQKVVAGAVACFSLSIHTDSKFLPFSHHAHEPTTSSVMPSDPKRNYGAAVEGQSILRISVLLRVGRRVEGDGAVVEDITELCEFCVLLTQLMVERSDHACSRIRDEMKKKKDQFRACGLCEVLVQLEGRSLSYIRSQIASVGRSSVRFERGCDLIIGFKLHIWSDYEIWSDSGPPCRNVILLPLSHCNQAVPLSQI